MSRSINTLSSNTNNADIRNANQIANLLAPNNLIEGRLASVDLTRLKTNIIPTTNEIEIGNQDRLIKKIWAKDIILSGDINPNGDIIPSGNLVSNLGSPDKWFNNIYVNHAVVGLNSIQIGDSVISSVDGNVHLPYGTKIGRIDPGTIFIKGTRPNTDALPVTNIVGDAYVIGSNLWVSTLENSIYGGSPNGWVDVGAFVGPPGPTGVRGPIGIQGIIGPTGRIGPIGMRGPVGVIDTSGAVFSGTINIQDLIVTGNCTIGKTILENLYNLDVSGSLNATQLYENGVSISSLYATNTYVTQQINTLLDSAPDALNTLYEISQAMGSDPNFSTHVYSRINTSDTSVNYIQTNYALKSYVDASLNNIRNNSSATSNIDASLANIRTTYAKSSSVDASLANYALSSSLDNILTTYAKSSSVDASLANYALSSSLATYALSSNLNNYATNIYLSATYPTKSYVDTSLANYATNIYLSETYTTKSYIDTCLNTIYATKSYIDGSLNSNYYVKNYIDVSFGSVKTQLNIHDASINANQIYADANYATKSYIDGSLNENYATKPKIDVSFGLLATQLNIHDASINANKIYIDNSLNVNYATKSYIDGSLNTNYYTKHFVDVSFGLLTTQLNVHDASINANKIYVDTSLNANYYTKPKIDVSFEVLTTQLNIHDASINANKIYIDGSLNEHYYTKTYVDGSLNTNYYVKNYVDDSLNDIRNNYTTLALKTALDVSINDIISNYATTSFVNSEFNNLNNYTTTALKTAVDISISYITSNYATTSFVNSQFNNLINSAPDTLNTLSEIAIAIQSDVSLVTQAFSRLAILDTSVNAFQNNSSLNSYIDASLATFKTQLNIYDVSFTNIVNNYATTTSLSSYATIANVDGSLNTNYYTKTYVDGSLNNIRTDYDSNLNTNYYTKTYVDSSLNNIYSQFYSLTNGAPETLDTLSEISNAIKSDASFGIVVYQKIASTDLSINEIRSQINSISITGAIQDPSINSLYLQNTIYDASFVNISNNYYTKTDVDSSLNTNYYTKTLVDNSLNTNYYSKTFVDSSLNQIRTDYDSSLNTNYYTKTFVDNSLNQIRTDYDSSLNTNYYTKTFVDNSLNTNYYTKSAIDSSINTNFYNRSLIDASFALKTYVDTQIGNLINSAPETLNTLSEIATALQSDASFSVNVYARISSSDASINLIRSKCDASFVNISNNYYTKSVIDSSINTNFYNRSLIDASFALKTYVDTQIGNLINGAPETLNTLSEIATALQSDASFGVNVYTRINSSDVSINLIPSNYATTASLTSYATTASLTSLYTSDTSLNGNLTLGSGSKSIGINKQPSSLFSLDVSGSTKITGNLSLVKNPSDANYSYFDMSSVNMSVFNVSEKFYTMVYAAALTLNYAQGGIFYITNVTANVTSISITNVPSALNCSVSFTVMLDQSGSSIYFFAGTQITINGLAATTIFTPDKTAFVAPSAARSIVIHQFVILWPTSTPKVLAYMSSQG